MRVALYARYSDDRQNERSIDDQLDLARRHAAARGWTVAAAFSDAAISGSAMANRPGLVALLAAADAGAFDVVLVEDTDRLARNREHDAHVYNRLAYAGVSIATFTTDKVTVIESALKGLMNELYLVQLGEKTRRGMHSNAEKGLATGARLYGYATQPGGATAIVDGEAEIIRRVFVLFADYRLSGREIANAFNRDRIPGPRGGWWNASTLLGSAHRGNGILRSELYAGVKVWNRTAVRKDPQTGRRVPSTRPPAEWKRTQVEHLRIVPPDLWARTQARLAETAGRSLSQRGNDRRPGLFSGLLKCAGCGSSYTSYRRGQLVCAGHREKGPSVCSNAKIIDRALVERRALDGLRKRLLSPAAVAAYVRAYHAAWAAIDRERRDRRRPLERRLAELGRSIERMVDAICDGTASDAMTARLVAQEAEKAEIARELASGGDDAAAAPFALHPGAADAYAGMIDRLRETLGEIAEDPAAAQANRKLIEAVRGLVERIEIVPNPRGLGGVDLRLHGNLSLLLAPAPGRAPSVSAGSPLVAGGGYSRAPSAEPLVFAVPLYAEAA